MPPRRSTGASRWTPPSEGETFRRSSNRWHFTLAASYVEALRKRETLNSDIEPLRPRDPPDVRDAVVVQHGVPLGISRGLSNVRLHEQLMTKAGSRLVLDHCLESLVRKPGALPGSTALEQGRSAGKLTRSTTPGGPLPARPSATGDGTTGLTEVLLLGRHTPHEGTGLGTAGHGDRRGWMDRARSATFRAGKDFRYFGRPGSRTELAAAAVTTSGCAAERPRRTADIITAVAARGRNRQVVQRSIHGLRALRGVPLLPTAGMATMAALVTIYGRILPAFETRLTTWVFLVSERGYRREAAIAAAAADHAVADLLKLGPGKIGRKAENSVWGPASDCMRGSRLLWSLRCRCGAQRAVRITPVESRPDSTGSTNWNGRAEHSRLVKAVAQRKRSSDPHPGNVGALDDSPSSLVPSAPSAPPSIRFWHGKQ